MKAAIYARVSTEEQALRGYSLQGQVEACRARANEMGFTETEVFVDNGYSGATVERPALVRLRECLSERAYSAVITLDPDRLSRSLVDLLLLTDEIQRAGCRLIFINMAWENTPEGILFLSVRGAISQFEKAKIVQRTMFGKKQKVRRGGIANAPSRIFGYRYDCQNDLLTIDDKEAAAVRRIFQLCAREGLGARRIGQRMREEGWPAPQGGEWVYASISRILRNPAYAGRLRQFHKGRHGQCLYVPVPSIITDDLWEEVQQLVDQRLRRPPGRPPGLEGRGALLSGRVFCEACNRRMYVRYKGVSGAGYYACIHSRRHRRGDVGVNIEPCPNRLYHRSDRVDMLVWEQVARRLGSMTPDITALETFTGRSGLKAERERLAGQIHSLRESRRRILSLLGSGMITGEEAQSSLEESMNRLKELEIRVLRLDAELAAGDDLAPAIAGHLKGILESGKYPSQDGYDPLRQAVVRSVVNGVLLGTDGRIVIRGLM